MGRFVKKPVVVEAEQWWPGKDLPGVCTCDGSAHIHSLEGRMGIQPGDWVIVGVAGERYPCKPDIFAATYDPVGQEGEGTQA